MPDVAPQAPGALRTGGYAARSKDARNSALAFDDHTSERSMTAGRVLIGVGIVPALYAPAALLALALVTVTLTPAAATAQGRTSACRTADSVSARLLQSVTRIAASTDAWSAELRAKLQIPGSTAAQIALVTDKTVC